MVVGEALGDTQFHTEIHLRGLALLPDAAPEFIKTMVVEDAMTKDVIVLRQREKKETIRKLLECTTHHGYPVVRMDYLSLQDRGKMFDANEEMRRVEEAERAKEKNKDATDSDGSSTIVDEQESFTRDADTMTLDTLASYQISLSDGRKSESVQTVSPKRRLAGVITRKQLKRLAGLDPNEEIRIEGDFEDFMRTHEKNTRLESKDEADLKEYFMAETDPQAVDLVPLMNHPPYIVKRDMSLHKAYAIFRKLGLRHLCVVNDEYDVIGLLTRKNFDKVINHGGH
jgi:CBS domain-containing protein